MPRPLVQHNGGIGVSKRKPTESSKEDFMFIEKELLLSTHPGWRDDLSFHFELLREGDCSYPYLYRFVHFLVLSGYSTFNTMEDLYDEVEKKRYYTEHPFESTGYKYNFTAFEFTNKWNSDENENKILHTANK